ncbi:uncharacterized protein LOC121520267 [Cheilinus undulatus]|uniref:uncharacterized protein LOC121520267 n=1 Tax=Cheilinus undulatus TaxID=241271 RepID=UPI001BD39B1B|nr:uncharacterized protein LOC121520267 [Cheilinus undulatus]
MMTKSSVIRGSLQFSKLTTRWSSFSFNFKVCSSSTLRTPGSWRLKVIYFQTFFLLCNKIRPAVTPQPYLFTARADGRCEAVSESGVPPLMSQLVLVCPQQRQSVTSPQVLQRIHHGTECFSSQLLPSLVSMATELIQDDLTLTRRVGENVSFSCGGTDRCLSSIPFIFWYQKKESDTFRLILLIGSSDGKIYKGYNHPQEDDFSSVNKGNGWELQIQRVKLSHSASYFCSCYYDPVWITVGGYNYFIFGSGTKLVVTDHEVLEPVVSLYSAASRDQQEEKSPLLCVASAMFPPLVQISWKRQKDNGPLEEVPPAEGEQLEIRESGPTSSILLINQTMINQYQYLCSVKHEGNSTSVSFHKDQQINPYEYLCSGRHEGGTEEAATGQDDPFRSECRVRLLTLLYSVLIVKSLVYCCGLCLLTLSAEEP